MSQHVAAVMPTRGRQSFAMQAIECYLAQEYPAKTLVIVDDEDDRSFPDGIPEIARLGHVYYAVAPNRQAVGKKRNLACEIAQWADYILHLDSDDWSAPDRIAQQVELMESSGKAVVGYHSMYFTDGEKWWAYSSVSPFALGTSLCYRRDWWAAHPFPEKQVAEDGAFCRMARDAKQIASVPAGKIMVASVHPGNTSPRKVQHGASYRQVERPEGIGSPFEAVN